MYNNVNSSYIKRLLVVIIMMAIVVVGGSFAWFTYQSKEAALVLTIGDINDTQIILTPYQINGVMAPGTTYESGIYSEVTVNKGTTNSTSFALFYKINELDPALIDLGLSYTITNSQTGDVVKTGKFSDLIDTSKQLPDEVVILDANTDTTLSASTSVYYRVYLWLDSSVTNQNSVANTKLDIELNGSIGSVVVTGNSVYGHKLSTTINDGMIDGNDSYTYQWYSNTTNSTKGGTLIEGATDSTYIVGSGLAGKYIYVVVTSSNGKTLSDITDNTNNYQVDNECDNYNDGRVERETPIITLSSMSGTVEAGPVGGSEENYPNAYNSFTTTINKSQNSVLDTDYAGTLTVVSSNTSNVTIVSGTSTSLTTLGGSNVIKYHGEPSIPAGSNITVTFTPSDTTNVCTISGNYSVNKVDTIEPVQPSVTLTDCDTFTYLTSDVVGITGYYISTVNNKPTKDASACTASNTLNCWTTNTSFSFTANTTAATYYVWAKDAAGNISESSNTQLVKITRTEGEGTTLTTRYNSTSSSSGTVYTDSIYVLKNCPIYSSAVANSGYNAIVLKHNGTSVTTSGTKATITDAFTVESSSTENTATITINKDGVAWSNSGMNVALYSGTTLKYAYNTATASDSTVVWEGVAPGTYNIYAGKSSNAKTELLDSGIDITIGASTSATTTYSATINYYSLTLQKGVGISAVSNGGTSTIDEVAYLRNSSSIQAIAIDATVADGYTWSTWSKVSGTTLSTITAATKSQNIKMAAGAAVYKATSKYTAVPTVTRTNNETNTYTYVTTAGAEYYVSTSTTAPSATAATCEEGTVLNCWTANNTFTIDESTTAAMYYVYVKDAAGSVSSGKAQIYSATPSITVSDYNTFTYTATSAKAYYVTMTDYGDELPSNVAATSGFALDKWTTTTSTGNLTLSEGTYYVYTKDATAVTGNISPIRASVNAYKITRTQGTGTTLTTKYTSSDGTSFTGDVVVLSGGKVYAKSVITTGYNAATLRYGDTSLTASGQTFVVNGAGAIVSSATANKVTITINENGSAANTTGYSVSLSTSSSSDTATFSGTTNGSTISFESGTANLVSGTTYYIWSGKSSNDKTTRIYSGITVKGAASTTTAASINYYGLTLQKGTGIDSVSNGGTSTTNEVKYLYHATASSRQAIAIDATILYGYAWSTWTKTSGTALTTFTEATQSQNVKMGAGSAVLTASADPKTYTITFDANGGSGAPSAQTKTYGTTLTLSSTVPTRSNYTFLGWSTDSAATSATYSAGGSYTANAAATLYAVWKSSKVTITFDPNGGILGENLITTVGQTTYSVSLTGSYKLEAWGAQGGTANSYRGGYGGYSVGTISLNAGTNLYVNVGGQGDGGYPNVLREGGYNGGGKVSSSGDNSTNRYVASGGGATHIATSSGTLSSLSSNTSAVLIVAGGGGGGFQHTAGGTHVGAGGDAGGYVGKNGAGTGYYGLGATQTTAGTAYKSTSTGVGGFGYGGDAGSQTHGSAGGGGWYGGGGSAATPSTGNSSGGGGSGYIGNSSLTNKAMYCYSCSTSSAASTLTYSTTNVSSSPIANYAKSGSGAAKITMLANIKEVTNGSTYGSLPTPSKSGDGFKEWNTKADGSGTKITSDSIVNLTSDTTLYAIYSNDNITITFNPNGGELSKVYYIVGENTYNIPTIGNYKLEVWGAQGGSGKVGGKRGGYGGYSVGTVSLTQGSNLYVNVGGKGTDGPTLYNGYTAAGGYNGGGTGTSNGSKYGAGGGGATHIATVSGKLSTLSSQTSSILIVAGGGGAGFNHGNTSESLQAEGGHAGGYTGNGRNPGTQTSGGGTFGQGQTHTSQGSGGGGGYYGGGNCSDSQSCGGGSGYIGNNSLTNKAMYCYNCTTSTAASTLTYSVTNVSEDPISNYAKTGNGAAKITSLNNTKVVTNGSTYGTLLPASKSGYKFKEWNTKADGSGTTITSSSIVNLSGNTTLYAIYESSPVYLFSPNDQHTDITGGWSRGDQNQFSVSPFYGNGGSQSIGSTMNISWQRIPDTTRHGAAYYSTIKQIDLTDVKSIVIEATVSGYLDFAYVGVTTDIRPWGDNAYWNGAATQKLVNGTTVLDVSSLSGSYYFMIGGSTESNLSSTGSIKATEIKLLY